MDEKQIENLAGRILKPFEKGESQKETLERTNFNVRALSVLGQLAAAGMTADKEKVLP